MRGYLARLSLVLAVCRCTTDDVREERIRHLSVKWVIYPPLLHSERLADPHKLSQQAREHYQRFWAVVQSMKDLRHLRVWLDHSRMTEEVWAREQEVWLEPIREVQVDNRRERDWFLLRLPVASELVTGDVGQAVLVNDESEFARREQAWKVAHPPAIAGGDYADRTVACCPPNPRQRPPTDRASAAPHRRGASPASSRCSHRRRVRSRSHLARVDSPSRARHRRRPSHDPCRPRVRRSRPRRFLAA